MNLDKRLSRSTAIAPAPRGWSALIVGVGGAGSNVLHLLVSMGFTDIAIVDFDIVEEENIFPAFFPGGMDDVGHEKSVALEYWAGTSLHVSINAFPDPFAAFRLDRDYDLVFMCVDSQEGRREVMRRTLNEIDAKWIIDTRMGGVTCSVGCVPVNDQLVIAEYERTFMNAPNSELPCGMKSTAMLTKGWIPGMVGQIVGDVLNGTEPPYLQRYDLTTRIFGSVPLESVRAKVYKEIKDGH